MNPKSRLRWSKVFCLICGVCLMVQFCNNSLHHINYAAYYINISQWFAVENYIETLKNGKCFENFETDHQLDAAKTEILLRPETPPCLVGRRNVSFDCPSLAELSQNLQYLSAGGRWKPKNCIARNRVAIIVPFSGREQQLPCLLENIHPILRRQQLDYGIYVVEQGESELSVQSKMAEFRCAECDEKFGNWDATEEHVTIRHVGWVPFKCSYCAEHAPTESQLRRHRQAKHPSEEDLVSMKMDDVKRRRLNDILGRSRVVSCVAVLPDNDDSANVTPVAKLSPKPLVVLPKPVAPPLTAEVCGDERECVGMVQPRTPACGQAAGRSCALCNFDGVGTGPLQHVCERHIEHALFGCSSCMFTSKYPKSVREHIAKSSHADATLVDKRPQHKAEIRKVFIQCFGEDRASHSRMLFKCSYCTEYAPTEPQLRQHRQAEHPLGEDMVTLKMADVKRHRLSDNLGHSQIASRQVMLLDDDDSVDVKPVAVLSPKLSVDAKVVPNKPPTPVLATEGCGGGRDGGERTCVRTVQPRTLVCGQAAGRSCALCDFEGVGTGALQHVCERHIEHALFGCSSCVFTSKYAKSVREHIAKSSHADAALIDKRPQHKLQIRELFVQCFGEDRANRSRARHSLGWLWR